MDILLWFLLLFVLLALGFIVAAVLVNDDDRW